MLQFGERELVTWGRLIGPKLFWPEAYHLACASSKLCEFIWLRLMMWAFGQQPMPQTSFHRPGYTAVYPLTLPSATWSLWQMGNSLRTQRFQFLQGQNLPKTYQGNCFYSKYMLLFGSSPKARFPAWTYFQSVWLSLKWWGGLLATIVASRMEIIWTGRAPSGFWKARLA